MTYRTEQPTAAQQSCQHERVYADFVLTSYPAQHPWVCRKCGFQGVEMDKLPARTESYHMILKRFNVT